MGAITKFINKFLLSCFSFFLIFSCGEDRTSEYEELSACDHWMTDVMRANYLWGDSIKIDNIPWKSYFNTPQKFFSTLIGFAPINDHWSWCSLDTLDEDYHQRGFFNHLDSYGLDFILMTDPTGKTSKQYARVKTVIQGSPADRAGLGRGDFIGSVDEIRISSSNTSYLVSGKARKLIVNKLDVNQEENEFFWCDEDTIFMEKSEYVEDIPFPILVYFHLNNKNIAYLMCNRLTSGPIEKDNYAHNYIDDMKTIAQKIKEQKPNVLILDLRLCNNGDMDCANLLASYIIGSKGHNKIFAKTIFNKNNEENNKSYFFIEEAINNGIEPNTVFVITSKSTAGPAEWLIRSLYNTIGSNNVFVVGESTEGQVVMTKTINSNYYVSLHPAVAYVADENGDYDYKNGIAPDVEINEMSYIHLYPYGDEKEIILSYILNELLFY